MDCLHFKMRQNVNSTAQAEKNRVEFELTPALNPHCRSIHSPSPRQQYGPYRPGEMSTNYGAPPWILLTVVAPTPKANTSVKEVTVIATPDLPTAVANIPIYQSHFHSKYLPNCVKIA